MSHNVYWDGLPADVQRIVLSKFRPQRDSKLSATSRQFRDALHHHMKLFQTKHPERFMRDTLEMLCTAPRYLDVDVSGALYNTVIRYCQVGAHSAGWTSDLPHSVITKMVQAAEVSRRKMQQILIFEFEDYARRVKDADDIRRFFRRAENVFRYVAYGSDSIRELYGGRAYDRLKEDLLRGATA